MLVGTLPGVEMTTFESLEVVELANNDIRGDIPSSINNLRSLEVFDFIDNTAFGGALPPSLFELNQLTRLWLDNCNLSGSLPSNIGDAIRLSSLSLPNTGISGTIPTSISRLNGLVNLWLQENTLRGPLPAVDSMLRLQILRLSENSLTGTIPTHYGQKASLEQLALFSNSLDGTIPDFSQSIALQLLFLSANNFNGSIERVFTTTPTSRLIAVSLDRNQLSGTIPPSIGNYIRFIAIFLGDNPLITGTLPTEVSANKIDSRRK